MNVITCVEDLRRLHRRRVPRMFYDYAEAGAWTESTLARNARAFDEIYLRQRVAVDLSNRSLRAPMLGSTWAMPVGIAPTGLAGMQHADGEIVAARAAARFGVPFTLSTMSICSIEDVAAHTEHPFWFQLYVMKDRDFIADLIRRAKQAGCSALVLTLDLQIMGQRHRDIKNAMTAPPKLTARNLLNMATKPRWCAAMLGTSRRQFGNVIGHARGVGDLSSLATWSAEQLDPTLSWDDVAWVKEQWGGPLILKGIMDPVDARHAVASGADALIVSNHGGRQLDGAPASLDVLPQIRAGGGRRHGGVDGRGHSQRPGRVQSAGAGSAGCIHRQGFSERSRCDGGGGRRHGAGNHPQRIGSDHGVLRGHGYPQGGLIGHLAALRRRRWMLKGR